MPSGIYERTEYHKKRLKEVLACQEVRKKISEARKKNWQNSEYKKKQSEAIKEARNCSEVRERMSKAAVRRWQDHEYSRRTAKAIKEAHNLPETRVRHSKIMKRVMNRTEVKDKLRKAIKQLWQNQEYKEKQVKAIIRAGSVKPNKAESELNRILNKILPKEYKYVGDGEFILAGKCPDFINVNGQKKIIELFGNYWHKGDDGKSRTKLFKKYGYQTLIVWESELKNIPRLLGKLLQFNEAKN